MSQTKLKVKQIEKITAANINDVIDNSAISAAKLAANVTDTELGYLSGVTTAIQTQLNRKLEKDVLKTVNDAPDWTSDLIAVTARAIAQKITNEVAAAQIGGAMTFKGNWSAATINSSVKAGCTYVYDSGTAPTGHTLETGDMLIAKVDNPGTATAANWTVVQSNINGAVTSIETSSIDGGLAVFNGTGGKQIRKSSVTGLLKADNGVVSAASDIDLPRHTHLFKVLLGEQEIAQGDTSQDIIEIVAGAGNNREDVLPIIGAGIVSVKSYHEAVMISASITVINGDVVSGQYITGLSITNDGMLSLSRAALPAIPAKTDWKTGQIPTGTLNGTNRVFTIPESIIANTEAVIVNGQTLTRGVDYTISGITITLATDAYIPVNGDIIRVNYVKA